MAGPAPPRFGPTLASLRTHPVPDWYQDAKLGIFVHWTMASVPAFAPRDQDILEVLRTRYDDLQAYSPYVEWYENSLRFPDSPVARHHREHYGDAPLRVASAASSRPAASRSSTPTRGPTRFAARARATSSS